MKADRAANIPFVNQVFFETVSQIAHTARAMAVGMVTDGWFW